jgi:Cof subfamily protein (haloacid dehalogenase superfamily)
VLTLPASFPADVAAFACDLDRTLIAEDAIVHPRTLSAIAAARGAGIRVVVVTGRMYRSVRRYVRELGLDEPVVCYQGAVVADATGAFLRHVRIPVELAREALAAVTVEGHHVNCYVDDELYVARVTDEARAYADFQGLPMHEVGDLVHWLDRPPTKLVAVGERHVMDDLERRVKARFDGRLYISKSLPEFLEFAAPEVTKASGFAAVAELLDLPLERVVAFGDGENDVELLQSVGYAVAVDNAHDRVLAVADFVCPPDREQGVAQVIEAYLALNSAP